MHQVQLQLTDQLYDEAKRRALSAGFTTVDEFAADVLADELTHPAGNLEQFFTPERIAHIDSVIAKVEAGGKTNTMEEAGIELATRRADWIRQNGK